MLFRLKYIHLVLFLTIFQVQLWSNNKPVEFETKRLLILGDSHLKGWFGEYLHIGLHNTGKFDIMSIGIGGAGSKNFVLPLQNRCCGYKIRISNAGEVITDKVRVIERAEQPTQGYIAKDYSGRLDSLLFKWKPDAVVIALGSNYINAHQDLINILKTYKSDIPFVWVGPFLRKNVAVRYQAIEKVMKDNPWGLLVRSDDIVGNDTLSSAHYVGKTARYWANTVVERMEPYLDRQLYLKSNLSRLNTDNKEGSPQN